MMPQTKFFRRIWLSVALLALGRGCCAAQSPAARTGREISGVVVSAKSGEPLAEAHMMLARTKDRKQVAETDTDAEGRFAFESLGDGKFDLSASRRGYVAASYEQHDSGVSTAIVTGDGLVSTGLRFELLPQAAIYGTVAEDSGDPVPMARVSLYRKDPNGGTGRIRRMATTMSDAVGNFELPRLAPGAYFACAMGSPWYARRGQTPRGAQDPASRIRLAALNVAYPPTCYPDVTDPQAAAPILLAGGDRVEVNLAMHPLPAVHLELQMPSPDDIRGHIMPQFAVEMFGNSEPDMASVTYTMEGNGRDGNGSQKVEIDGLPPGQYEVEFPGQNGEASRRMSLDAAADNPPIDLSAATPLAAITGKVTAADGGSMPSSATIRLTQHGENREAVAQIAADGTFTLQSVRPGEYDVVINSSGFVVAITSLSAKGGTLSGARLKVGSDAIVLTAIVGEANATVSGVVKRDGSAKPGVFVVMAPADMNAPRAMWRANQSDSDGTFDMAHVAPGTYTVAAIEQGWTLDWSRPEVIAPYLARGAKVTVAPGVREVEVKDAFEAQPLNLQQAKAPDAAPAANQ
jgi:hypothetical protein